MLKMSVFLDPGDRDNADFWEEQARLASPGTSVSRTSIIRACIVYGIFCIDEARKRIGDEKAQARLTTGPWHPGFQKRHMGDDNKVVQVNLLIPDRLKDMLEARQHFVLGGRLGMYNQLLRLSASHYMIYGLHQMHDESMTEIHKFLAEYMRYETRAVRRGRRPTEGL